MTLFTAKLNKEVLCPALLCLYDTQQPELVILDEATSTFDTNTEMKLHKALSKFLEEKTTLIVAHRLSALKQADLIYVLEDGKVVEFGTHHGLLKGDSLY